MRFALALITVLSASPALADYSDHSGVTLFTERPCTEAIAAIDAPNYGVESLSDLEPMAKLIARRAMAWGFVLGFDTAMGGLSGSHDTTLKRLRVACAASPDVTAAELLRAFDQD